MEHSLIELWSFLLILASAFIIGWAAETAQTFIPRALALSILAWLQTLPEFAVEAEIAWQQHRELMIANLTGSLRLLVGLGWPLIFFTHLFFQGIKKRRWIRLIELDDSDFLSVFFLFISVAYFVLILAKGSLTVWDSGILTLIYIVYLRFVMKFPPEEIEDPSDLPWIGRKILRLAPVPKVISVGALFFLGGWGLWVSVEPFIHTLRNWSVRFGISTFVFIQWVAPFLSEFPEKLSAFNWARQPKKAPMAVMNMVNSNINQWTLLAAMIPVVFSVSLGHLEGVTFSKMAWHELALTIAQSFLGGILLLDLQFSFWDALLIFTLWLAQFLVASLREEVTIVYLVWIAWEIVRLISAYAARRQIPKALVFTFRFLRGEKIT